MKTAFLFACTCLTASASFAATPRLLAGETARQAGLRGLMMARSGLDPFAIGLDSPAAPTLVSGKIERTTVNVVRPPVTPAVSFTYTAPAFLQEAWFDFVSPSGQQSAYVEYGAAVPARKQGALRIESLSGAFSLYSEPGAWQMESACLYDWSGAGTCYGPDQLATIFPNLTVNVTNNVAPDTTMPTTVSAHIKTRTVSVSSAMPWFKAEITATDDLSGVAYVYLLVTDPNGVTYYVGANSASHTKSERFQAGMNMSGMAGDTGTWIISGYYLCDEAGNCTNIYDQQDLTTLFGSTSFTVTP